MDTAIQKADAKIRRVLSDKEALRAYQMREMAKSDYTSTINFARREGEQRGRQETSVTIANEMKADNVPFDLIQKYTGLSMEEIERL
jgi:predicted transposase/invertase (TIGR01784 family)